MLRKRPDRPSVDQLPKYLDSLWTFIRDCMSFQAAERPRAKDGVKWLKAEQKVQARLVEDRRKLKEKEDSTRQRHAHRGRTDARPLMPFAHLTPVPLYLPPFRNW